MTFFLFIDNAGDRSMRSHPEWRTGDTPETARIVSDDELVAMGYGRKVIDIEPDHDPVTQRIVANPCELWPIDATTATKTYRVEDIPIGELKTLFLAAVAEKRWEVETAGVVIGGIRIKTDRESAAKLTAAYVKADRDPGYAIANWKVADGTFVTLSAAAILAAGDAVSAHVQACFDREAALSVEILASTDVELLSDIDIESGWPE
jgi:hypothetical protein